MMRNSKFIAMALAAAVLLVGCNANSPTAPKPTPLPASLNISLTPETSTAEGFEKVPVTARVTTSAGANAPDGTTVNFKVDGGVFVDCTATTVPVDKDGNPVGATEAVRTTSSGGTAVCITSRVGTATISAGVVGDTAKTAVTFAGVTPTPTPDYTPVIDALLPNAGPFEGGTRVTISGVGFESHVQVLFDDIQAQVVTATYTQVVCISPSITATAPQTVVTKQVTVTNLFNGKVSKGVGFRYGVTMFISSFSPMEGPADTATTVTIFGQGFVAPVTVVATLGGQWDVLSVAGTEIVVRTKALPGGDPHACDGGSTTFTVTNINSNQTADSPGSFSYRGVRPLITSVQVDGNNLITQCGPAPCAACGTHTMTIRGSGFQSPSTMAVTLSDSSGHTAGPLIPSSGDANTLTVNALIDLSGFTMDKADCSPPTGGKRNVSTPVSVEVKNIRYDCSDTLRGGIVVVPCDIITCAAGPTPTPTPVPVPTLAISPSPQTVSAAGTLPATVSFTIIVTPAQAITVAVTYAGTFVFTTPPLTVTTNASGLATLTLTVPTGVSNGQSATATISYLTATPATATVNIGP
jgi:hypothetical protein